MVVEVTFRGNFDASNNRYFMVFGNNSTYQVPLPPPNNVNEDELIEPGETPVSGIGTIASYYTNYYSTWAGYCFLEPGGYFAIPGPFVLGQTTTREFLSDLGTTSTKVRFTFRLSQIFSTTVPSTIYFDFLAVAWPSGIAKLPADHLTSTNAYLSNATVVGSTNTIDDPIDNSIAESLDIIKCTVTIQ